MRRQAELLAMKSPGRAFQCLQPNIALAARSGVARRAQEPRTARAHRADDLPSPPRGIAPEIGELRLPAKSSGCRQRTAKEAARRPIPPLAACPGRVRSNGPA